MATSVPSTPWIEERERPSRRATRRLDKPATRWAWRLGSIFGIDLYVHATFVILLAWVAFSHLAQGHGVGAAFDGLALVLAVFGVVVLHELGHALTARRFGIRTQDITLLPIGGVARLERIPEKPMQELLVAFAGPAVNVVLALVLAGLIVVSGGSLVPGDLHVVGGSFLTKLLWINVSLAVFNLMPAFPMDGGRVLRAALAFRMEHARATEIAARIGQAMALLFGILGLFANPMLLLIAFFVWMGAQQESSFVQLRSALSGVPIRSAMITEFRTLAPSDPLGRAAELVLAGFQHDFPVVDDGRLVGVLTRGDIVKGLAAGGWSEPIGRVMHTDFATAESAEMLGGALDRLREQPATSLVVLKEGRLVGMLTLENIGQLIVMKTAIQDRRAEEARLARWARWTGTPNV